jgi:hypothetical protein
MKGSKKKQHIPKINKLRMRWALRLFIVSFFFFFGLSLFFFPTYTSSGQGTYIPTIFGQVRTTVAAYILLLAGSIWMAGWAIMWEERKALNSRTFIVTSWLVPISIAYMMVSLFVALLLEISSQLMTIISFVPPLLVVISAPQLLIRGMLGRFEKLLSRACFGFGIFLVAIWGAGASLGAGFLMPVVELVIPVYLGVLILEYLSLHLRLNGWKF